MLLPYRQLLFFILALILFFQVGSWCKKETEGFSLANISSNLSYDPRFDVGELPVASKEAFLQPYFYLGCGGQCYAFISEDQKYVLKFFKYHHYRFFPSWLIRLPLPFSLSEKLTRANGKRKVKLERNLKSYTLAFKKLQAESGLIALHLNKTDTPLPVVFFDKLGIKHVIDLSQKEFVVQTKAELLYPYLESCMRRHDVEAAKKALHQMVELISHRCSLGIYDEDPRIHKNLGFSPKGALFIDAGRFIEDPFRKDIAIQSQDLHDITHRLKKWLLEYYPELAFELDEALF